MAGGAVESTVPDTGAIQVFPRGRLVRVCGEGGIPGQPPVALRIESRRITRATPVAHLARGQIEPTLPCSCSHRTQVAVAVIASDLVHGATLTLGALSRMAEVARRKRRSCMIEAGARRGIDDGTVQAMHIHSERVDAGNSGRTEHIGGVTCGAQDRGSRLGRLIQR